MNHLLMHFHLYNFNIKFNLYRLHMYLDNYYIIIVKFFLMLNLMLVVIRDIILLHNSMNIIH